MQGVLSRPESHFTHSANAALLCTLKLFSVLVNICPTKWMEIICLYITARQDGEGAPLSIKRWHNRVRWSISLDYEGFS